MKYFAKINYLGTDFHGFQVQPGLRTVQSELSLALEKTFSAPVRVTGCSRTDAGVHANEFCVKIECDKATVPADKLPVAVSRYMPSDVSLYYAEICRDDFHPRYSVAAKEYEYRFYSSPIRDPFEDMRSWHIPCPLLPDAVERMNEAAGYFVGTHNFASYMAQGSKITEPTRTVKYATVERQGNILSFRVCADGFLYNMVRIMAGTLYEVAVGRRDPRSIATSIEAQDRVAAGLTAPPHGLYLSRVFYERPDVLPAHWE